MFIKIIFSYILGFVKISVEGYYIERFINICKNKKITVWNLKRSSNIALMLNVRINEFREVCKVAKKTGCKLKIKNKKGLPFLLHRYKKRKIFLILLIVVLLIIGLSSMFVWNVDISIEDDQELVNIRDDIENAGLKTGILKSKIDTKEIINKIRLERKDVAWMGIELKGTNAIVRVVKADEAPEIIDENEYCNIVSNKTGIITKINVQEGTANVKVGDTIKEGDVLINGWMEGKFTGVRYVHAKGEIEARVWYTKSKKIPYVLTEKQNTGNEENKYRIKFGNFEINFPKKYSKFKIYDTIEEDKKFKIFSNLYLPISVTKITNEELQEIQKEYTIEEATAIGTNKLEQEIETEIGQNKNILRKKCRCRKNRRLH